MRGLEICAAQRRRLSFQIQTFTFGIRFGLRGRVTRVCSLALLLAFLLVARGLQLVSAGHGRFHFFLVRGRGIFRPILDAADLADLLGFLLARPPGPEEAIRRLD